MPVHGTYPCAHPHPTIDALWNLHHGAEDCGRDWFFSSAEGATAPETLRQTDRTSADNSGKRTGTLHGPTEGATSAQLGNLSGVEDRGGTEFAAGRV